MWRVVFFFIRNQTLEAITRVILDFNGEIIDLEKRQAGVVSEEGGAGGERGEGRGAVARQSELTCLMWNCPTFVLHVTVKLTEACVWKRRRFCRTRCSIDTSWSCFTAPGCSTPSMWGLAELCRVIAFLLLIKNKWALNDLSWTPVFGDSQRKGAPVWNILRPSEAR